MSDSHRTVVLLDDEPPMIEALQSRFRGRGWSVRAYTDVQSFSKVELLGTEPAVYVIDHDLGSNSVGYDIVRELRKVRPDGLSLPIVYLTGRESEKSYLEHRLNQPNLRPSCFINKNRLAHLDLIEVCEGLLEHFHFTLEQEQSQSLRRAVANVARSVPEEDSF